MNVVLPTETKMGKTRKIIYMSVGIICGIAAIVVLYVQFIRGSEIEFKIGNNDMSDDEYQELKVDFDSIFTNTVIKIDQTQYEKHYDSQDIVFTGYSKQETKDGEYNLNVNIPYINITNEKTIEYNKDIISTFQEKAQTILNSSKNVNVIYTVEYSSYIQNGILSIIIRSNLKEGTNSQRTIIQTYNYDLVNKKEVTINDMLSLKGIDITTANDKIKKEIQDSQNLVEEMKKSGYTIYERNVESDIYKIENATEFFLGKDQNLYIVYAYGNEQFTSEMDLVIFQ